MWTWENLQKLPSLQHSINQAFMVNGPEGSHFSVKGHEKQAFTVWLNQDLTHQPIDEVQWWQHHTMGMFFFLFSCRDWEKCWDRGKGESIYVQIDFLKENLVLLVVYWNTSLKLRTGVMVITILISSYGKCQLLYGQTDITWRLTPKDQDMSKSVPGELCPLSTPTLNTV